MSVVVGWLWPTSTAQVGATFAASMIDLVAQHPQLVRGHFSVSAPTMGVARVREEMSEQFVASRAAEYLLFVDSDVSFPPDALPCILDVADPTHRPVVSGLYFGLDVVGWDDNGAPVQNIAPEIYKGFNDDLTGAYFDDYPPEAVVKVAAAGCGFLLVHRSVFERVKRRFGSCFLTAPTLDRSEDISFCYRCGELDIPIHCHTGVKVGHLKPVVLDERSYRIERGETCPCGSGKKYKTCHGAA